MRPLMQKWEYCLVLAHLEGSYIDKTVVVEEAQTTSTFRLIPRTEEPRSRTPESKLGLSQREVPVPQLSVLAINGNRPKEDLLSMYALASELGEQGWGLVSMEHTIAAGSRIVSVWVFQRPKPLTRL